NFTTNYIYMNTGYTSDTCKVYATMAESFVELYNKESRKRSIVIVKKMLELWFTEHQFTITIEGIRVLENVMTKAIEEFCSDAMDKNDIQEELSTLFDIIYYIIKTSDINFFGNRSKNKTYSLIEIVDILITQQGYEGIAHTLKKMEELFSFKRSSYYSFVPQTREIIGVYAQDMHEIKKIKTTLLSQKPFELTYQTKKSIYIRDSQLHFEEYLVKKFQLVSMIIIPVYFNNRVFGWIVLDNIGEKFSQSIESLEVLEEIGRLLGVYIDNLGLHEYENEVTLLSNREKDVLFLLAEGLDNKKIGLELYLSEHTVRDNISQLMLKLGAKNRTHLVAIALRKNLIK
ncbi:MAG: LuxR C-terminal-related transcriptional regulator, partial [Lysinibacillus sp.]